jgi:Transposase DDE domain
MRVEGMVRQLLAGCSSQMHEGRVKAVVKVAGGIIEAGRLSPASIGRSLPGTQRPKHGIKCVDRLLGNRRLWQDQLFIFLAIAHRLLRGCANPVILVDWTTAGGPHEALVAAVPIGGRALPIYLEVHPRKKLGNVSVETRFLCTLRAVLPSECVPVVVTDAGFKSAFFREVMHLGWDFLGRIRGTSKAASLDGKTISKDEFYARASIEPTELGTFRLFTKRNPITCRLVLKRSRRKPGPKRPHPKGREDREHRKSARDPWLLATSLTEGDARHIVALYARRMQIEETFRDAKNHRFGWSLRNVALSTSQRTQALLLLAVIAYVAVTLVGIAAEKACAHRAYQANTARRRVLSFFVLACAILRRNDTQYVSSDALDLALASIPELAQA